MSNPILSDQVISSDCHDIAVEMVGDAFVCKWCKKPCDPVIQTRLVT